MYDRLVVWIQDCTTLQETERRELFKVGWIFGQSLFINTHIYLFQRFLIKSLGDNILKSISTIVFDLGGVLIELGSMTEMLSGSRLNHADLWSRWLTSPTVRTYESGQCDTTTFAHAMLDEFEIDASPDEFIARFEAWPIGGYTGAASLLEALGKQYHLVCLSNTNELHWQKFISEMDWFSHFHVHLPSHQTGRLKPDADVYEHMLHTLDVSPDRVVFLDDNEVNVKGAIGCGLHASQVKTPGGAGSYLRGQGLL